MSNKQSHPSLQDDRFIIKMKPVGNEELAVKAPLPENFGFTVGSEFSAPFDAQFVGGAIQKAFAASGVSSKLGVSTRKMYSNPEPTEISFDMQFEAYESAMDDVLIPIIKLMSMSIGRRMSLTDAANTIEELINSLSRRLRGEEAFSPGTLSSSATSGTAGNAADRVFGFLGFIAGPSLVKLRFGNIITFKNTYVTSVAPSFSNILDPDGVPMSATVSVTCILEEDPTLNDENFEEFFSMIGAT